MTPTLFDPVPGTAWAHLPNAALIDWVLADVRRRPEVWVAAWDAALDAAWAAARVAARAAARDAARAAARAAAQVAARDAARVAALDAAWDAAWDITLALITWDDAQFVLDLSPDAFRLLLAVGEPRAVLLAPLHHIIHQGMNP